MPGVKDENGVRCRNSRVKCTLIVNNENNRLQPFNEDYRMLDGYMIDKKNNFTINIVIVYLLNNREIKESKRL